MNNVIELDSQRPHRTTAITCGFCEWRWVAVYPESTNVLQCPLCHQWVNEFGTHVSRHVCVTCGARFTVCPAVPTNDRWENCLADECASYDPNRDVDRFFGEIRRDDE